MDEPAAERAGSALPWQVGLPKPKTLKKIRWRVRNAGLGGPMMRQKQRGLRTVSHLTSIRSAFMFYSYT